MQKKTLRSSSSEKLDFLQGLRGLSSLYIVFHHAAFEVVGTIEIGLLPKSYLQWGRIFNYGTYAVNVFIVLSGFCLALSVVDRPKLKLPGGIRGYLFRRCRRILPPYYACLLLCLGMIYFLPSMNTLQGTRWDVTLPAFNWGVITSHLFLVHNLRSDWIYTIDYPLWSVATEWQIYFFFPGLLWILRKYGATAMVAVSLVLGAVPHKIWPQIPDRACPWFIALFAFGVAGAYFRNKISGKFASVISLGFLIGLFFTLKMQYDWLTQMTRDVLLGGVVIFFILFLYKNRKNNLGFAGCLNRFFDGAFSLKLGDFSYSLYLIHAPILAAFHLILKSFHLSAPSRYLLLITVGVAISLAVSRGFYTLFERPFLKRPAGRIGSS